MVVVSFDQHALVEGRAGSDEGDQVGCVDRAPAALGGLNELVGHGDSGGAGARPLGDPLAQADGREGRLDGIRRA